MRKRKALFDPSLERLEVRRLEISASSVFLMDSAVSGSSGWGCLVFWASGYDPDVSGAKDRKLVRRRRAEAGGNDWIDIAEDSESSGGTRAADRITTNVDTAGGRRVIWGC